VIFGLFNRRETDELRLTKQLAEQGSAEAQDELGLMYFSGTRLCPRTVQSRNCL